MIPYLHLHPHPQPTVRGMVSTARMIEQLFSPLTSPPCYSWIPALYSMDKWKSVKPLVPLQSTFCICSETLMISVPLHPDSLNTSIRGCPLSRRNAFMTSTCRRHSNTGQTLSSFCFPRSSSLHYLPQVREILGPRCTMPSSTSTFKSKARVSFPYQSCRLQYS